MDIKYEINILIDVEEKPIKSKYERFANMAYSHYLMFTEEGKTKYKFFDVD